MQRIRERHRYMAYRNRGGDKRWFGFALLVIGIVILLRKLDIFYFSFHTMWPWILIFIGMVLGVKHKFRNHAWWILSLIGVSHLIPEFYIGDVSSEALIIPVVMIGLGIAIIFRPRRKNTWDGKCEGNVRTVTNSDSELNVDVTFGGHKEIVTSKDFRGGNISTTFGGAEINMMNAATTEKTITLHLKVAFGGVELIVPSHWQIKNELSNSLGSVEDNRNVFTHPGSVDDAPTLVLTGTCSFGSVEIKSY